MIEKTIDNRFEIKAVFRIDDDPEQLERLKLMRINKGYDVLIKDEKNGLFLLCNEISDATIITEETFDK